MPSASPADAILLSIIVPTRNRQHCAESLIQSVHAAKAASVELLIQDNSDDDRLGQAVAALDDQRIRYIHTRDALNMHENFGRAIEASRGRFVCALGDDDGILVDRAMVLLERAADEDCDAVLTQKVSYQWPGLVHWLWGDMGGRMTLPRVRNPGVEQVDPRAEVRRVLSTAATGGMARMPRVYHGFVSRRALDRLRDRTGSYFPGGSPDMANAVGLSFCVDRMLYSDTPLVISGHSAKSGGGAGSAGRHHGEVADQPHLPAETKANWPRSIPDYWSGHTIYAESAQAATRAAGDPAAFPIDYAALYAACFVFDQRIYWPRVVAAMRANPAWGPGLIMRTAGVTARMLVQRAVIFSGNMTRKIISRRTGPGFASIADLTASLGRSPTTGEFAR